MCSQSCSFGIQGVSDCSHLLTATTNMSTFCLDDLGKIPERLKRLPLWNPPALQFTSRFYTTGSREIVSRSIIYSCTAYLSGTLLVEEYVRAIPFSRKPYQVPLPLSNDGARHTPSTVRAKPEDAVSGRYSKSRLLRTLKLHVQCLGAVKIAQKDGRVPWELVRTIGVWKDQDACRPLKAEIVIRSIPCVMVVKN